MLYAVQREWGGPCIGGDQGGGDVGEVSFWPRRSSKDSGVQVTCQANARRPTGGSSRACGIKLNRDRGLKYRLL